MVAAVVGVASCCEGFGHGVAFGVGARAEVFVVRVCRVDFVVIGVFVRTRRFVLLVLIAVSRFVRGLVRWRVGSRELLVLVLLLVLLLLMLLLGFVLLLR